MSLPPPTRGQKQIPFPKRAISSIYNSRRWTTFRNQQFLGFILAYFTENRISAVDKTMWDSVTPISRFTSKGPNTAVFLMQVITFPRRDDVRAPLSPGRFSCYKLNCLYPRPYRSICGNSPASSQTIAIGSIDVHRRPKQKTCVFRYFLHYIADTYHFH